MLREIIKPQSQEYINTEVEILVLPFVYPKQKKQEVNKKNIFDKTVGILASQNIDPIEWQNEIRNEWERE